MAATERTRQEADDCQLECFDPEEGGRRIAAGELIAFPTETVYGLGANACSAAAVERIYAAKERPSHNPLICHLPDRDSILAWCGPLTPAEFALFERLSHFWPGPLTILLPRGKRIVSAVSAGLPLAGFRVPAHPLALDLLRAAAVPVAAPSANLANQRSATSAAMVERQLGRRIDGIVDGGDTAIGIESTVVRLAGCDGGGDGVTGAAIEVVREGGVSREALMRAGLTLIDSSSCANGGASATANLSPGQLRRHYAPLVPLYLFIAQDAAQESDSINSSGERAFDRALLEIFTPPGPIYLLTTSDSATLEAQLRSAAYEVVVVPLGGSAEKIAHNLYRSFDALIPERAAIALIEPVAEQEIGRAINDRLHRAAKGYAVITNQTLQIGSCGED